VRRLLRFCGALNMLGAIVSVWTGGGDYQEAIVLALLAIYFELAGGNTAPPDEDGEAA
jgi:hypothetical protein